MGENRKHSLCIKSIATKSRPLCRQLRVLLCDHVKLELSRRTWKQISALHKVLPKPYRSLERRRQRFCSRTSVNKLLLLHATIHAKLHTPLLTTSNSTQQIITSRKFSFLYSFGPTHARKIEAKSKQQLCSEQQKDVASGPS